MRIAIGSDHGGYTAKSEVIKHLTARGVVVEDMGTYSEQSCDYPDIARPVGEGVAEGQFDRGILICGTGIGMSIAANKLEGVRAALCHDVYSARMTRLHNNSTVLCLGARVVGLGLMIEIVDTWLSTGFEGGRHQDRIDKVTGLEKAKGR